MEDSYKIKILCLHGYRQNGEIFKNKIGSFRKYFKNLEFIFATAPNYARIEDAGIIENQRSWWSNKDDGSFKGSNKNGPAFGFKQSLELVEEIWNSNGCQGLLGFSQGGCFVGIICGLASRNLTTIRPQFVIISSGFVSGSLVHKNFYEDLITVPSLHIYGTADDIIPAQMSEELASHFKNPQIVRHSGGHYFPATSHQKQAYIDFIQDRLGELQNANLLSNTSNNTIDLIDSVARKKEVCDE